MDCDRKICETCVNNVVCLDDRTIWYVYRCASCHSQVVRLLGDMTITVPEGCYKTGTVKATACSFGSWEAYCASYDSYRESTGALGVVVNRLIMVEARKEANKTFCMDCAPIKAQALLKSLGMGEDNV